MGRTVRVVLLATIALVLAPAPASAGTTTRLACGATITADTRLGNDLRDCHGIGIVIAADGVDLDLNGHLVDGDGVGDFEGINVDGYRNTSIRNGAVRDFVEGAAVLNARGGRVSDLALSRLRHVGVFISDSAGLTVTRTRSTAVAASGVFVTRSHDVAVLGNSVTRSGGGIGMRVSDHVRIAGNTISDVACGSVALLDGGTHSVIEANRISGPDGCDGIGLSDGSDGNVVRGNVVSGAGGGVGITASNHNVVTGNTLRHNAFVGIYVFGGDDNTIDRNAITANGDGSEGGVHLLVSDTGEAPHRTAISGNTIEGNVGDGVLVDAGVARTVLTSNRANRNTDDGIDVDATGTTLTGNTANRNDDLGIEAVPGTRGSGNTASGNGDPRQCTGVACG
jgi:parallel beta-helix repeat protein